MLSGCESLERLYIPSKAVLTWYTLRGMKTLSDMYVYSEMPQSLNTMFFQNSFNYKKTVLHVKKVARLLMLLLIIGKISRLLWRMPMTRVLALLVY